VAAYIELNPVRAALCSDPKDYRYCGYAQAVAKGCAVARQGVRTILAQPATVRWEAVSQQYRKYLFLKGSLSSASKAAAFDPATAQRVVHQQDGQLPLPQILLCRIRYFTDGVILGSQSFVQSHFDSIKQRLGLKRRSSPTHLTILGSPPIWVFRSQRIRTPA
jgi:putative transposase